MIVIKSLFVFISFTLVLVGYAKEQTFSGPVVEQFNHNGKLKVKKYLSKVGLLFHHLNSFGESL